MGMMGKIDCSQVISLNVLVLEGLMERNGVVEVVKWWGYTHKTMKVI